MGKWDDFVTVAIFVFTANYVVCGEIDKRSSLNTIDFNRYQNALVSGGCSIRRRGQTFNLNNQCCSMKVVVNGIKDIFTSRPNAKIPNIKDATRNFIDPDIFKACQSIRFTENTASTVKILISEVTNGESSSPLLPWISIMEVTVDVEITVDLTSQKEATVGLVFSETTFPAELTGNHLPSTPGLQIRITKENAYDDINYSILQLATLEMSLEDFLRGIGVKTEYMLDDLDFRVRGPINGVVAEGLWTVRINGDNFFNQISDKSKKFWSGSNAFLFCQYNKEDEKGPKCSLNSEQISGTDWWNLVTTVDMPNKFLGGGSFDDSPISVLQSSKVEIDVAFSTEVKQKLLPFSERSFSVLYGSRRNRQENQAYVSTGTCLRYLRESFQYTYSDGSSYGTTLIPYIFNVCLEQNSVTGTFLPAFSLPLDMLIAIVMHQPMRDALKTKIDNYGILVKSMKYIGSQTCATFTSLTEKHHEFIKDQFPFENTVVTVCGDDNMATITAEGREKVLDAETSVDAKLMSEYYTDDPAATVISTGWFLTGSVKIFDIEYVLEKTGQHFMGEGELEWFPSFKKFALTDTVFKAPSSSQLYLTLEGTTHINHNKFKFELVSRSENTNDEIPASLALCLRKEGGTSDEIFSIFYKEKYKELPYSFEKTVISVQKDVNFYTNHQASGTGIIFRCQNVEIKHKEEGVRITGSHAGSVRAMLETLVFGCDASGEGSKKSSSCQVIKNGFGGGDTLEGNWYGRVAMRDLRLSALINKPFIVADGIEIKSGLQHVLIQNTNDEVQEMLRNQISGQIDLGSHTTTASIIFNDDTAVFELHEYTSETSFNLYGVGGISQNRIFKSKTAMTNTRWSNLEIQGNIILGSAPGFEIDIENDFEGAVRQFMYGDTTKNRFYACAPTKKEFTMSLVLQAFGAYDGTSLFSTTILKEVCVAYHNDENDWDIKFQGFKAKQGLRLYGTITSLFGYEQLKANVKLDGDVEVNIELPVLKFGARTKVNERTGQTETRYAFTFSKMKSLEDYGPTFTAIFNNRNSFGQGKLTGHIKLPMYEGQVTLTFNSYGHINQDIQLVNSESGDSKIKPGKINLSGTLLLGNVLTMGASRFTFSADLLLAAQANLAESCTKEFTEINKRSALALTEIGNQYTSVLSNITSMETQIRLVNGNRLKRSIQELETQMLTEIRKVKKQNQEHCKPLKLSGFKLEKSCGKRNSLQNATCLKFIDDAFDATDTTCLEESKNNRKGAHQNALKKNNIIRASSLSLREKRTCYDLFDQINNHYKAARDFLLTAKSTDLPNKINSLQSLGTYFSLRVAKYRTVNPMGLSSIPNDVCIDFELEYNTGTPHTETKKLCALDSMFDDLGKRIVTEYIRGKEDERNEVYNEAITKAAHEIYMANLIKKKNEDDYELCKRVQRARKREKVFVPEFFRSGYKNQAFRTNAENTESMMKYYAPWNVMKRNNPMTIMSNSKPNRYLRMNHVEGSGPCSDARNKIESYGTMVDYMKTWVDNYQKGLAKFKKINENVVRGLKKRNMTQHQGFAEFTKETESQLNQLNHFAPSYMKNELNALINPKQQDQLENFLYQTSTDTSNLIKKSFPQNDQTFSNLSNMLIQQFSGNKTLDEMAPSVKEMEKMMTALNKRTLVCHDEL